MEICEYCTMNVVLGGDRGYLVLTTISNFSEKFENKVMIYKMYSNKIYTSIFLIGYLYEICNLSAVYHEYGKY